MLEDGDIKDAIYFVEELRRNGYNKDIVAASSHKPFRNRLLKAGCNQECPKAGLIEKIAKIVFVRNKKP